MLKISTMDSLFKKAICIKTNATSYKRLSGLAETLNLQNFKEDDKRFNTSNGILAFTSNGKIYIIPNFNLIVSLLKSEGFHQDYLMPVPDTSKLVEHYNKHWTELIINFRSQISA